MNRGIGKVQEVSATIQTTYGELPADQAAEIIAKAKQREKEAAKKAAEERAKLPPLKRCPFANGTSTFCKAEQCALFNNYECAIVTGAPVNEKARCPFGTGWQKCGPECALYSEGSCKMCNQAKSL